MKFLIKIGVIVLVLGMGSFVYAGSVMKEECKTKYNELNKEKTVTQQNYMKAKRSLRTKMGKMESQEEADAWQEQDKRLSDDYNNKMKDMKQEMESLYNNPSCWE